MPAGGQGPPQAFWPQPFSPSVPAGKEVSVRILHITDCLCLLFRDFSRGNRNVEQVEMHKIRAIGIIYNQRKVSGAAGTLDQLSWGKLLAPLHWFPSLAIGKLFGDKSIMGKAAGGDSKHWSWRMIDTTESCGLL